MTTTRRACHPDVATNGDRLRSLVRDGDRLFIGTGAGEPQTLIRLLVDEVLPYRRDVELVQVAIGGSEVITETPRGRGHRVHLVAGGRRGNAALRAGEADVVPASMGSLDEMIAAGTLRIDGALVAGVRTGASEAGDLVSPGISLDLGRSAAASARFRALELNQALPDVRSVEWLREGDCDLVVTTDVPLPEAVVRPPTDAQRRIGEYIAALVPAGACVELGIGQALRGVAAALCDRAGRDPVFRMTIHTGMITDDVRLLLECGAVAGQVPDGGGASVVATVALGSASFYRWLSGNPAVYFVDSALAHRPAHLMSIGPFAALNSAAQVDLLGNVGARDRAGALAGGGLPDFAAAGAHSAASIIALETRDRDGRSKVVAQVEHVQLHASAVTHLVTEFGAADLRGAGAAERIARVIAVAHPDDRAELRTGAERDCGQQSEPK